MEKSALIQTKQIVETKEKLIDEVHHSWHGAATAKKLVGRVTAIGHAKWMTSIWSQQW